MDITTCNDCSMELNIDEDDKTLIEFSADMASLEALGGPLIVQSPDKFTVFGKAPNSDILAEGTLGNAVDNGRFLSR